MQKTKRLISIIVVLMLVSGLAAAFSLSGIAAGPAGQTVTFFDADINQDGIVSEPDLEYLLENWGAQASNAANPRVDINDDGVVNAVDLNILLYWFETASHDRTIVVPNIQTGGFYDIPIGVRNADSGTRQFRITYDPQVFAVGTLPQLNGGNHSEGEITFNHMIVGTGSFSGKIGFVRFRALDDRIATEVIITVIS